MGRKRLKSTSEDVGKVNEPLRYESGIVPPKLYLVAVTTPRVDGI
jgi:hypothetical protein